MRTCSLLAAGCLLSLCASAQTSAQTSAPTSSRTSSQTSAAPAAGGPATLSVNASLVVVPVTVRDKKDHLIRTLTREDFTLTVDGKPQNIRYFDREDDLPLTLGLLVDVSGSQRTVLDAERTASAAFLDGMLQPDRDRAFVVQFGHSADLLADITPSVAKLQAALQKIDADTGKPSFSNGGPSDPQDTSQNGGNTQDQGNGSNGGYGGRRGGGRGGSGGRGANGAGTVLYDAVFLSSDEVLKKAPSKDGQTRKALILLTDGDDRGSKESLPEAIEAAQRNDTTLYAIYYKGEEQHDRGFGGGGFPGGRGGGFPGGGGGRGGGGYPGGGGNGGGRGGESRVDGKKILERMADETGGRVYEVSKKMPLTEIYRQIAEELRSQYRLGFTPNNAEAGYHKLIVDIPKDKKLILQARDGYYTGAASK